jgi:RNA recognition motif-containing protein
MKSSVLSKFLAREKISDQELVPPPYEKFDSIFLADYNKGFSPVRNDPDADSESDVQSDIEEDTVDDNNIEGKVSEDAKHSIECTIKIFNLPYQMDTDEIMRICSKYGVEVDSVSIDIDLKSGRPAGSARAHLLTSESAKEAVTQLNDRKFNGRTVRVRLARERQRQSDGDNMRYFDENINCKCLNCGEVGHKRDFCSNKRIPQPCHFCGLTDHEAGDCSFIVCFRCREIGHHSRDCQNGRIQRTVLCTICGANTHETRRCRYTKHDNASEKVENDSIICIICRERGHVNCKEVLVRKEVRKREIKYTHESGDNYDVPKNFLDNTGESCPNDNEMNDIDLPAPCDGLFCPNCGNDGHHVDYQKLQLQKDNRDRARTGDEYINDERNDNNICLAPRQDAYQKFPNLLNNEIFKLLDCNNIEILQNKYMDLCHGIGNEQSQNLFPLLRHMKSRRGRGSDGGFHSRDDNNHRHNYNGNKGRHSWDGRHGDLWGSRGDGGKDKGEPSIISRVSFPEQQSNRNRNSHDYRRITIYPSDEKKTYKRHRHRDQDLNKHENSKFRKEFKRRKTS